MSQPRGLPHSPHLRLASPPSFPSLSEAGLGLCHLSGSASGLAHDLGFAQNSGESGCGRGAPWVGGPEGLSLTRVHNSHHTPLMTCSRQTMAQGHAGRPGGWFTVLEFSPSCNYQQPRRVKASRLPAPLRPAIPSPSAASDMDRTHLSLITHHVPRVTRSLGENATPVTHWTAAQAAAHPREEREAPGQGRASAGAGNQAHLGNGHVLPAPLFPSLLQPARPGPGFRQRVGQLLWKGEAGLTQRVCSVQGGEQNNCTRT